MNFVKKLKNEESSIIKSIGLSTIGLLGIFTMLGEISGAHAATLTTSTISSTTTKTLSGSTTITPTATYTASGTFSLNLKTVPTTYIGKSLDYYLTATSTKLKSPFTGKLYTVDQLKDSTLMAKELEFVTAELIEGLQAKEYSMETMVKGLDNVTGALDWSQFVLNAEGGHGDQCNQDENGNGCGMNCGGNGNGNSCGGNCNGEDTGTLCGDSCHGGGEKKGLICGSNCKPENLTSFTGFTGAVSFKPIPTLAMDRFYNNYLENLAGTNYFTLKLITAYKSRIVYKITSTY